MAKGYSWNISRYVVEGRAKNRLPLLPKCYSLCTTIESTMFVVGNVLVCDGGVYPCVRRVVHSPRSIAPRRLR
jgi:hypothetical protein